MSEYWKSTPKYWCKHCKTYVRDTKIEKQNHDATPKHQGNLKRFLRDLHRDHEKGEKDKDRAKAEVARLNGIVSGTSGGESSKSTGFGRGPTPTIPHKQATPLQRKQQLSQLAEMGVSIPDEFRGDMAMPGEWQIMEERILDGSEKKPEAMGIGVRKRVAIGENDEEDAIDRKKRRWGSTKAYPEAHDDDLDTLLNQTMVTKKTNLDFRGIEEKESTIKAEPEADIVKVEALAVNDQEPKIKGEPEDRETTLPEIKTVAATIDVKVGVDNVAGSVVFKKRKAKPIRQK